ncbi:import inner membrane translocase subunit TIM44-2, partial [Trifolium medium]|nr:import inner membrane translocase subunit TIM44-2 [Trifolium medium]
VSHNVKEKISAAAEEVKVGIGKQDTSESNDSSTKQDADAKQGSQTSTEEEKNQESASGNASESLFGKFKSTFSSPRVKSHPAFKRFSKVTDPVKTKSQEV